MSPSPAPSLLGTPPATAADAQRIAAPADAAPRDLMDLFHQGFCMVFLLRDGHAPADGRLFRERLRQSLQEIDRGAKESRIEPEDALHAKFAFSALVDEIVLSSPSAAREDWERHPLQLELFGEHRAGEKFFELLETLRGDGARRLQVLEVFHMSLLAGFKGRYAFEGTEKLAWLTARLGDEIVHLRGKRPGFAPHWAPPDRIVHRLRGEAPSWAVASAFALAAMIAFIGLRSHLEQLVSEGLAAHADIVKLAPQSAHVVITLP